MADSNSVGVVVVDCPSDILDGPSSLLLARRCVRLQTCVEHRGMLVDLYMFDEPNHFLRFPSAPPAAGAARRAPRLAEVVLLRQPYFSRECSQRK